MSERDAVTAQTALTDMHAGRGPARETVLAGKYRVESTLGFGGMGLVIRAHNIDLDERVAIKVLRDDVELDDEHLGRFLREAKAAVRLKSEHVARIRDVGTLDNGRPYMVMELLEGLDLGKLLVDQGWVEPVRAVELLLQTCDAIAEAHANGIVHRDIKPTNLFLTKRRDGSDLLKVLDFGISKAQSGPEMSLTQTSSMLGTPAYMSPEQMRSARAVDFRSDIWSLGVVLYELVEGRRPFDAQNFAELCIMVSTEPPTPMTRGHVLAPIIERCLEKGLARRYQNVAELAADLAAFSADPLDANRRVVRIARTLGVTLPRALPLPTTPSVTAGAVPVTPKPSTSRRKPQRTLGVTTVLALVLLFGVGIAAGLYVTANDDRPAQSAQAPADAPLPLATPVDAAVQADASVPPDAGSERDAGSGSEQTIKRPPPRKPRKPPPKSPEPVETVEPIEKVEEVEPPPPPPPPAPPVKKCDPFANPKGCPTGQ